MVVAPSSVLAAVVRIVADIAAVNTVVDHIAVADIAVVVDIELVAGYKVVVGTVMTVQYSLVGHTGIVFDTVAAAVVLVDVVPTAWNWPASSVLARVHLGRYHNWNRSVRRVCSVFHS